MTTSAETEICCLCQHPPVLDSWFQLTSADGARTSVACLRCTVCQPSLVRRAGGVALVVGTILTLINQGDIILEGRLSAEHLWKIPLTFLVPYLVSTYSALGTLRRPGLSRSLAGPGAPTVSAHHDLPRNGNEGVDG